MRISIVTAVMNRADSIGEAIRSLQAQSFREFEHIVIDGMSTDGTLDVVRSLADHRTLLVSEKDKGIYDALNKGFAVASGDFIGVLHSDDVFANADVLSDVVKAFQKDAVDAVYGDLQYVSKANPTRVLRHWQAGDFRPGSLARGWMPPHPALFVRRSFVEQWGAFDTQFRIAADYEVILRYLIKGGLRIHYVPRVFVKMRTGGESNASLRKIWRKTREDYVAIRRHGAGGLGTLVCKNLRKLPQFWTAAVGERGSKLLG